MPTSAKKVAKKAAAPVPTKKVAAKKVPAKKAVAAKKVAVKASGAPSPIKDTFTKASLAAHIAERAAVEPKTAKAVLAALEDTILGTVHKKGAGEFTLSGLLKIVVQAVPAKKKRFGKDPFSGEERWFPASRLACASRHACRLAGNQRSSPVNGPCQSASSSPAQPARRSCTDPTAQAPFLCTVPRIVSSSAASRSLGGLRFHCSAFSDVGADEAFREGVLDRRRCRRRLHGDLLGCDGFLRRGFLQ